METFAAFLSLSTNSEPYLAPTQCFVDNSFLYVEILKVKVEIIEGLCEVNFQGGFGELKIAFL